MLSFESLLPPDSTEEDALRIMQSGIQRDARGRFRLQLCSLFDLASVVMAIVGLVSARSIQSGISAAINTALLLPNLQRIFQLDHPSAVQTRLPYVFAYGTTKPNYRQIIELSEELVKELERMARETP